MKICLVTAFPPSRGGLSEYGFHIARELQQIPLLSLTVLADIVPGAYDEQCDISVVRCWNFNDRKSASKILRAIREIDPDIVWFNLLFTTFGHDPLPAFRGLTLPVLTRLAGYYTHVTLHHLVDFIDLEGAGIRFPRTYRAAGAVATKMLLLANSLSVLMPAYRSILVKKYGGGNVHFRTHGILAKSPEFPDFSRRGNPVHKIIAFGKWGTYKRPEVLIKAFKKIVEQKPNTKLVIAGGDHPRTPGYIASLARKYEGSKIEFTGYVPEEKIADLFRSASVMVMPYSSATGASGVAHLACAYGVPILSSDVRDFVHMAEEEEMAIEFYRTEDSEDLAEKLLGLLESPERQKAMAGQNFLAALRMTMPRVIYEYVRDFGRAQQTRALRPIRWFRRLPPWVSRSFLGKAMLRGLMRGNNRLRPPDVRPGGLNNVILFNFNGHVSRDLGVPGSSHDSDGVTGSRLDLAGVHTPAGADKKGTANQRKDYQNLDGAFPVYLTNANEPHHSKCEQARIEESLMMLPEIEGGNGHKGNGKGGSHKPGTRSDGGKRTGHTNG